MGIYMISDVLLLHIFIYIFPTCGQQIRTAHLEDPSSLWTGICKFDGDPASVWMSSIHFEYLDACPDITQLSAYYMSVQTGVWMSRHVSVGCVDI